MSEFLGMALYKEEEIRSALDNFREVYNKVNKMFKDKISVAENNYTPTRWGRFWYGATLKDYYRGNNNWQTYYSWLEEGGFITFTEEELVLVFKVNTSCRFYMDKFETEYRQVKDLFNGGKDVYLNPQQARMVNKFKEKI